MTPQYRVRRGHPDDPSSVGTRPTALSKSHESKPCRSVEHEVGTSSSGKRAILSSNTQASRQEVEEGARRMRSHPASRPPSSTRSLQACLDALPPCDATTFVSVASLQQRPTSKASCQSRKLRYYAHLAQARAPARAARHNAGRHPMLVLHTDTYIFST